MSITPGYWFEFFAAAESAKPSLQPQENVEELYAKMREIYIQAPKLYDPTSTILIVDDRGFKVGVDGNDKPFVYQVSGDPLDFLGKTGNPSLICGITAAKKVGLIALSAGAQENPDARSRIKKWKDRLFARRYDSVQ